MTQLDITPCTCPNCDDLCRGECGCLACIESEAFAVKFFGEQPVVIGNIDDPYCPVLARCEHCGRAADMGHKPECLTLGGDLSFAKRRGEKLKEQIKGLKRELALKEAELR